MKLPKIKIEKEKLDINFRLYFFLKYLVKAKFKDVQLIKMIEYHHLFSSNSAINEFKHHALGLCNINNKSGQTQFNYLSDIFTEVQDSISLEVFLFAIRLIMIKDLLLAEAKLKQTLNIERLKHLNPLSLEYDKITVFNPYLCRVNGALLSLIFFDGLKTGFISQDTDDFIVELSKQSQKLQQSGIEPNQIFMLLFNESLNQSITSNSGTDYEDRIKSVLLNIGINNESITKTHDTADKSTEFDLFFELKGKTYGIGAKRTLRERYKQFIKTAQMSPIDVMIEITLGTDLTAEKAKSITNHGIYLFVADEIYQTNTYLQELPMIYSTKALDLKLLEDLAN